MQLAKSAGAEVFATAGTDDKLIVASKLGAKVRTVPRFIIVPLFIVFIVVKLLIQFMQMYMHYLYCIFFSCIDQNLFEQSYRHASTTSEARVLLKALRRHRGGGARMSFWIVLGRRSGSRMQTHWLWMADGFCTAC
jgi:hypothetical protein